MFVTTLGDPRRVRVALRELDAAIDLARLGDRLRAVPRAATRVSRFAPLAACPDFASSIRPFMI
jgi:hypothetical protein